MFKLYSTLQTPVPHQNISQTQQISSKLNQLHRLSNSISSKCAIDGVSQQYLPQLGGQLPAGQGDSAVRKWSDGNKTNKISRVSEMRILAFRERVSVLEVWKWQRLQPSHSACGATRSKSSAPYGQRDYFFGSMRLLICWCGSLCDCCRIATCFTTCNTT